MLSGFILLYTWSLIWGLLHSHYHGNFIHGYGLGAQGAPCSATCCPLSCMPRWLFMTPLLLAASSIDSRRCAIISSGLSFISILSFTFLHCHRAFSRTIPFLTLATFHFNEINASKSLMWDIGSFLVIQQYFSRDLHMSTTLVVCVCVCVLMCTYRTYTP